MVFCRNPVPMLIYEPSSLAIPAANDAFQQLYGYSHHELLAMSAEQLRQKEDIPKFRDHLVREKHDVRRSGIWRHLRRDGTIMFVQVESSAVEHRGRPARLVACINVDDKLRAERLARRDEARLDSLLDLCQRTSSLDEVGLLGFAVGEARALTSSTFGYLHLVSGS